MSQTATAPPAEAFRLVESSALASSVLSEDGTIELVVIRPTIGRGRGRHLYTPEMLAENAHKFTGWKMYNNHLTDAARKALGGNPRHIEDMGGRILESWWNPDYPAEGRFDQGAVIAKVRPVGFARQLIQEDPEVVEASINARATGVRKVRKDGVECWLVEGIGDEGSVDWVSEAGAGGRVASLMEAWHHDEEGQAMAELDALTDTELIAKLRAERPKLVEALVEAAPGGHDDPDEQGGGVETTTTPIDALREALATDEGREALSTVVNPLVEAKVQERLDEEREFIIAEARADADRQIELRDLRDIAHTLIRESNLPESFKGQLLARYTLTEGAPSPDLDVVEELDESGAVAKPADAVLRESVQAQIEDSQRILREAAAPTRVTGQGSTGSDDDPSGIIGSAEKEPLFHKQLREAKVDPGKPTGEKLED